MYSFNPLKAANTKNTIKEEEDLKNVNDNEIKEEVVDTDEAESSHNESVPESDNDDLQLVEGIKAQDKKKSKKKKGKPEDLKKKLELEEVP